MISLCRWIDVTEDCSIVHGSDQTEPLSHQRFDSLPSTTASTVPQRMNEPRNDSIVFEHEESRQCVIIDVTSLSEGIDFRTSEDSRSVSCWKGNGSTVSAVKHDIISIHCSPKSVEDISSFNQDEHEHQQQECSRVEAIRIEEYESARATCHRQIDAKKMENCQWGKMIDDSDWTGLHKSLTRYKHQRRSPSENMIIYSKQSTTVLHLAAHKAPTALILLLLDVMTTCCDSHPNRCGEVDGIAEVNSKNYCLCGDNDGNTPLHIVFANLERTQIRELGIVTIDFSVVKNLLVLGPEALVMQNNNGDTPLHLLLASKALQQPDDVKTIRNAVSAAVEAISAILGMAKDMALKQNANGLTPLHVAIANHCPKSVLLKLLITVPEAATITDNDGMNSLHYVASFGVQSWSFVEHLILAHPQLICQQTIHGDTPLHLLVANTSLVYFPGMSQALSKVLTYNNSRHTMKLLTVLSRENIKDYPILAQNAHGDTPLHFCAKMNAPALITQSLMESQQAQIASTITTEIDMTPLRTAMSTLCRVGDSHDAVGLRNAMCNVVALAIPESCRSVDSRGLTPLMHAVQSKKWSSWLVKILLQADQECATQATPDGLLALHFACQNKKLKSATLRDLISAYPSGLKALTNDMNTPLHYAAIQGVESVMQFLIKKHPKAVQQRNADGEWPIDLAIKYGVDAHVLEVFELSTSVPKKSKKQ